MGETLTKQEANPLATIDTNVNLMSSDSIDLVVPKRGEIHNGTIVKTSADQILIDKFLGLNTVSNVTWYL